MWWVQKYLHSQLKSDKGHCVHRKESVLEKGCLPEWCKNSWSFPASLQYGSFLLQREHIEVFHQYPASARHPPIHSGEFHCKESEKRERNKQKQLIINSRWFLKFIFAIYSKVFDRCSHFSSLPVNCRGVRSNVSHGQTVGHTDCH